MRFVRGGLSAKMLACSVTVALMGCLVLSANALKCHQCNSHLDEDCNGLTLAVPRGTRDDQYLSECEIRDGHKPLYCRKSITTINVSGETRIVRSCGWNVEGLRVGNDTCLTADNEGFTELICSCYSEACNSAPGSGRMDVGVALGAGTLMVLSVALARG